MAHAPGYKKLMTWSPIPIMPTPGAVGLIIEKVARRDQIWQCTTNPFAVVSFCIWRCMHGVSQSPQAELGRWATPGGLSLFAPDDHGPTEI